MRPMANMNPEAYAAENLSGEVGHEFWGWLDNILDKASAITCINPKALLPTTDDAAEALIYLRRSTPAPEVFVVEKVTRADKVVGCIVVE